MLMDTDDSDDKSIAVVVHNAVVYKCCITYMYCMPSTDSGAVIFPIYMFILVLYKSLACLFNFPIYFLFVYLFTSLLTYFCENRLISF